MERESWYIHYTPEITENLWEALIDKLKSKGYQFFNWCNLGMSYETFQNKGQYLCLNSYEPSSTKGYEVPENGFCLDNHTGNAIIEKTIYDILDLPIRIGDRVENVKSSWSSSICTKNDNYKEIGIQGIVKEIGQDCESLTIQWDNGNFCGKDISQVKKVDKKLCPFKKGDRVIYQNTNIGYFIEQEYDQCYIELQDSNISFCYLTDARFVYTSVASGTYWFVSLSSIKLFDNTDTILSEEITEKPYEPKVGDWIEITKGKSNWTNSMDIYIGKVVQITSVNEESIHFKDDGGWTWRYEEGHFKPASAPQNTCPLKVGDVLYFIKDVSYQKKGVIATVNKVEKESIGTHWIHLDKDGFRYEVYKDYFTVNSVNSINVDPILPSIEKFKKKYQFNEQEYLNKNKPVILNIKKKKNGKTNIRTKSY